MRTKFVFHLLVVTVAVVVLLAGCGSRSGPTHPADAGDEAAPSSEEAPDAAVDSLDAEEADEWPQYVGIAPFEVKLRLPADTPALTGERFCRWDLGDGTAFVGISPGHKYMQPGQYEARWSIFDQESAIAAGLCYVTVLPLVELEIDQIEEAFEQDWPHSETLHIRNCTGYEADHEILIAGEDGFSFVNTETWQVRMFVPYTDDMPRRYQEVPEYAETESYLFVDTGSGQVSVLEKESGQTVQQIQFAGPSNASARIWCLAADAESGTLYAIVYPDTYTPESGWIYRWDENNWTVERLDSPAPERPWNSVGEKMQLLVDAETETLFTLMELETLVTRDADGEAVSLRNQLRQAIAVLDASTGSQRGRVDIPIESDVVGRFSLIPDLGTLCYATKRGLVTIPISELLSQSEVTQTLLEDLVCGFSVDESSGDLYCITYRGGNRSPMLHRVNCASKQREEVDLSNLLPGYSGTIDIQIGFANGPGETSVALGMGRELFALRPGSYSLERRLPLCRTLEVLGLDTARDQVVLFEPAVGAVQFFGPVSNGDEAHLSRPTALPDPEVIRQAVWDDHLGMLVLVYDTRVAQWDPVSETLIAEIDSTAAPFQKSYFTAIPLGVPRSGKTLLWISSRGEMSSPMFEIDWEARSIDEGRELQLPDGDDWGRTGESFLVLDADGDVAYVTASSYEGTRICSIDWRSQECAGILAVDAPIISLQPRIGHPELWLLLEESLVLAEGPLSEATASAVVQLPDYLQFSGYPVRPLRRLAVLEAADLVAFIAPRTGDICLLPLSALVAGEA